MTTTAAYPRALTRAQVSKKLRAAKHLLENARVLSGDAYRMFKEVMDDCGDVDVRAKFYSEHSSSTDTVTSYKNGAWQTSIFETQSPTVEEFMGALLTQLCHAIGARWAFEESTVPALVEFYRRLYALPTTTDKLCCRVDDDKHNFACQQIAGEVQCWWLEVTDKTNRFVMEEVCNLVDIWAQIHKQCQALIERRVAKNPDLAFWKDVPFATINAMLTPLAAMLVCPVFADDE